MKQIFSVRESHYNPGRYLIDVDHDAFKLVHLPSGSYNIIAARVLGVSYANYLRICRDSFGAELVGKKSVYPVAHFKSAKDAAPLVVELNKRANQILQLIKE